MKCNRNRLHCQFNRNRRLLSRLNLEILTLHHCAMNGDCGGRVSSFTWVAEPFSKWGSTSAGWRTIEHFCGLHWQLWRHKHWSIASLPIQRMNKGLNYTILDKTTPLWKRIGEPREIQTGCYRGDPGHQRHSG